MTFDGLPFPAVIKDAVKCLCDALETEYPGITHKEYSAGLDCAIFYQRIQFAVYIELIKAEVIK